MKSLSNIFKSRIVSIDDEKYSMAGPDAGTVALRPAAQAVSAPGLSVYLPSCAEQARGLVSDAEKEALEILSRARAKSGAMLRAAYQKGRERAREDCAETLRQAGEALERICAEREAMALRYEEDILNLSVHIARKIIGESIEIDRAALTRIFKQAVDRIRDENEEIRVRLSLRNMDAIFPDELGVEVATDRTLESDECFVDTENGEVNISISSQIEQIVAELRNLTV